MPSYDAIIIGTGQAGPSLARRLVAAGGKVAIIERKLFGGTCVNTGCIPTKTMVASAYAAHMARRAADFGVMIEGSINVDMKAVKARKDAVVAVFRGRRRTMAEEDEECTVYEGHARFVAEEKVAVNGSELDGRQIFINVGGRAIVPAMPGLDQVMYLTNSSMMGVDFLPRHLIVWAGATSGWSSDRCSGGLEATSPSIEMGPRLIQREGRGCVRGDQGDSGGGRYRGARRTRSASAFSKRGEETIAARGVRGGRSRGQRRVARAAGGGAASEYG